MDKLQQLLKERGISFNGKLEAKVKELGFDPGKLTEDDSKAIAEELAAQSLAIAPSNGKSKPAPQQPMGKADTTLEDIKIALLQNLEVHKANLAAFEKRYVNHRNTYNTNWVNRMEQIADSTSSDALNELRDRLLSKEADPESFSRSADALLAELELTSQSNATA